jgi:hypothetical protein
MSMGETRLGGEKIEWNFFAVALGSVQVVPSWAWGVLGCVPTLRTACRNFLEFSDKRVLAPNLVRHSRPKLGGVASPEEESD